MAKNELVVSDGDGSDSGDVLVEKQSPLSILKNGDVMRSIIVILCLSIFLVLGLVLIFWARDPVLRPLGSYDDTKELNSVIAYLKQHQYAYEYNELLDGRRNVISVSTDEYDKVVEGLTVDGIISSAPRDGSEILLGDSAFGVSARKEEERLKYAREQQIANMLKNNRKIVDAKVLLAIPKRNVFSREEQKPSASVTIKVGGSGSLGPGEVDSIVESVASSVQGLETTRVTVIDQNGRLLNSGSMDEASQALRRTTELQSQKEAAYKRKIEEILNPILGIGNYTPMVAVALDPVTEETTSQRYNDKPTIRSEQVSEEYSQGRKAVGVPGAVSNQPPANSSIPDELRQAAGSTGVAGSSTSSTTGNERRSAVRNYEVDTTISHARKHSGGIQRLSISVAVNYKEGVDASGNVTKIPRTEQELEIITDLLHKGLGVDESRGDTLAVHTVPFYTEDFGEPEPVPFYENENFEKYARILFSALIIVMLIIFVVRPMIMSLVNKRTPEQEGLAEQDADGAVALEGNDDLNLLAGDSAGDDSLYNIKNGQIVLPDLHRDEDLLKAVRALVSNEPDLAAQVVKDWISGTEVK